VKTKQEIFEMLCERCIAVDDPMADIKKVILAEQFEFYFAFFEEFMQQSPSIDE